MSTAASDKKFLRARVCTDLPPMDSVVKTAKNKSKSLELEWMGGEASVDGSPSGQAPFKHSCYDFVGGTVPDNSDYPDSIAPIGSTYCRLTISGEAVTGAEIYLKTAAATWTKYSQTGPLVVTAIKTANYTVLATDSVVRFNTSGGALTLTLPTAVGVGGKEYFIKLTTGGNVLTIDGDGSETIDGSTTHVGMNQTNDWLHITSDGANWLIVGEGGTDDVTGVKTGAYTALVTDRMILLDSSGGVLTVTLPAAAGSIGKVMTLKMVGTGTNAVTVDGNASETIDGSATNTDLDAQYDVLEIMSDGSNWHVLNQISN